MVRFFFVFSKLALMLLVMFQVAVILLRYLYGVTFGWLDNLVTFSFASIFMLGITQTLKSDAHVRLDVFYDGLDQKKRNLVNLIGTLVFLIPVCIFILYAFWPSFSRSWMYLESFGNVDGLRARFLFKSLIPIMAISLMLYGVSNIFSLLIDKTKEE